jgi:hypothetical protein
MDRSIRCRYSPPESVYGRQRAIVVAGSKKRTGKMEAVAGLIV